MRSYGQFCPIAKASAILCERWTTLIIREMARGGLRFSELQRGVPLASPALISSRLKQLETDGIVERRKGGGEKSWVYHLTEAGAEFVPIVMSLGVWGQRWSSRDLDDHEMDLGLLLWAFEKGANADALGPRRVIVKFDITDQPLNKRHWWYVNEDGTCALCTSRPAQQADIQVISTLPDLIRVWRGDFSLASAVIAGRVEIHGSVRLCKAFHSWLATSEQANIPPASPAARATGPAGDDDAVPVPVSEAADIV